MKTGPAKIKKHRYGVSPATRARRRIFARVTVANCEKKVWATEEHPEIVRLFPEEGGKFVLNEWKQLLRPVQGGGRYECIGEFPDLRLRFEFERSLFKNLVLDHAVCEGLKPGDEWKVATRGRGRESVHHEVGVRVHFDRRDRVLRREEGGDTELPPRLLEAFREATPHHDKGNCYVNEYGIIFLPRWEEEGRVHPVFVARVDVDEEPWFDRPDRGSERSLGGHVDAPAVCRIRDDPPQRFAGPAGPSLASDTIQDFRLSTRVHRCELSNPIELLDQFFWDGGTTIVRAAFEHSYFVAPERVRKKTPLYPKHARTSRKHYPKGVRGGRGQWKGRKVKLGDNAKAQAAWKKYSGRRLVRGSGYEVRHPWGNPWDPDAFTAGWNLCYMPFWAAKLLDEGSRHEDLWQAFRQASWDLYFRSDPVCEPLEFVEDPGIDLAEILQGQPLLILAD